MISLYTMLYVDWSSSLSAVGGRINIFIQLELFALDKATYNWP